MEAKRANEVLEENIGNLAVQSPQKLAKHEHLARNGTSEEDSNHKIAPLVEAHGLTGSTLVLEGCRTVGDVMVRIAIERNILANRVVIVDPKCGRQMTAGEATTPIAQFVIINEEDAVLDIESAGLYLRLHAQQGDRIACSRLMELLRALGERSPGGSIWRDALLRRDAECEATARTLIGAGFSGVGTFLTSAKFGVVENVAWLLSVHPALIAAVDPENGYTALMLSSDSGHAAVVDILLSTEETWEAHAIFQDFHTYIEYKSRMGHTALARAIERGHTDVVDKLLAAGADVKQVDGYGRTGLIHAIYYGHVDVVGKLIAAGANVNYADPEGDAALIRAAGSNKGDVVTMLLAARANVNIANSGGRTGLILAAWKGYAYVVEILLDAGAMVDHQDADGDTALIVSYKGDVATMLLAAGANINIANSKGQTALMDAARGKSKRDHLLVTQLLAAGANVDHVDSRGNTALMLASSRNNVDVVTTLLAARANVDIANSVGNTGLMLAVAKEHTDVVDKLLAARAKVGLGNSEESALTCAATYRSRRRRREMSHRGCNSIKIASSYGSRLSLQIASKWRRRCLQQ